jgi:hypothetical protein
MKRKCSVALLVVGLAVASVFAVRLAASEGGSFQVSEYGTIRYGGRENTCFIRPNGKAEMLAPTLTQLPRPERGVDERAYLMNVAVNLVAREGFEVVGFTPGEILVKRAIAK